MQHRLFHYPDLLRRLQAPRPEVFNPLRTPEGIIHIEHGDLPKLELGKTYEAWQHDLAEWLKVHIDGEILFFILDSIVQKYFAEPEEPGAEERAAELLFGRVELRATGHDIIFRMNALAEEHDELGYSRGIKAIEEFFDSSSFYSRISMVITDLAVYIALSKGMPAAGVNVKVTIQAPHIYTRLGHIVDVDIIDLDQMIVFSNGIDLAELSEFEEFAIENVLAMPAVQEFINRWQTYEPQAEILPTIETRQYVASQEVQLEILTILKELIRRVPFRMT